MLTRTLVTLALLLQSRAEWVEISQQQYRKVTRPLHRAPHETPTTPLPPTATQPSRTYFNHTPDNPHWSKGNVVRVAAGIGRVEHVTKPNVKKTATNVMPEKSGQKRNEATDHADTLEAQEIKKNRKPESTTTEISREQLKRKRTKIPEDDVTARPSTGPSHVSPRPLERVTDDNSAKIGLAKRTYVHNARQPTIRDSDENATDKPSTVTQYGNLRPSDRDTESSGNTRRKNYFMNPKSQANIVTRRPSIFASTLNPVTRVPNRIYINNNKAPSIRIPSDDEFFITEKPTSPLKSYTTYKTTNDVLGSAVTRNHFRNQSPNTTPSEESYEYFVTEKTHNSKDVKKKLPITVNRRMDAYVTRNPYRNFLEWQPSEVSTPESITDANEPSLVSQELDIRRIDLASIVDPEIPDFITKQEFIDDDDDDEGKHLYDEYEETVSNLPGTNQRNPYSSVEGEESSFDPNIKNVNVQNEETLHQDSDDDPVNNSAPYGQSDKIDEHSVEKKPNPIENVVKFMKVVSDTISKNTHTSIKSKVRYLEDLKDTIMMNIEHRVDEAWPEDPPGVSRHTREARSHVDFPSSEGALMSISFLTFAVFLIKLIMQVIYKYKNQTMMVTPTVVAVSRAADTVMRRPAI